VGAPLAQGRLDSLPCARLGGKPAVATTAIEYRGYEIIITPPDGPTGQWSVLIWPLKRGALIPMPTYASENEATQAARSAIDQRLTACMAPD
jgi:hypothetical protein